jgi:hypothetical protein
MRNASVLCEALLSAGRTQRLWKNGGAVASHRHKEARPRRRQPRLVAHLGAAGGAGLSVHEYVPFAYSSWPSLHWLHSSSAPNSIPSVQLHTAYDQNMQHATCSIRPKHATCNMQPKYAACGMHDSRDRIARGRAVQPHCTSHATPRWAPPTGAPPESARRMRGPPRAPRANGGECERRQGGRPQPVEQRGRAALRGAAVELEHGPDVIKLQRIAERPSCAGRAARVVQSHMFPPHRRQVKRRSPGADVRRGEPSPDADVGRGEPSPGADVVGVSPVLAQMWWG